MRNFIIRAAVLLSVVSAGTLRAQNTTPAGYRDPGTAMIIGILVPGGGQMYTGETQRGLTLFGIGVGGLLLGTTLSYSSIGVDCDTDSCASTGSMLPAMLGYLAYLGAWGYGILDADDSAERMNAKRGLSVLGAEVQPVVGLGAATGEGTRVGVELRF